MTISAQRLKKVRRALGLTQVRFAAELEVSTVAVKHWESGRRSCKAGSAAKVRQLAEAAGLDLSAPAEPPQPAHHRPRYADLAPKDWASARGFGWCELKYDGYYAEIKAGPGGWTASSRTGGLYLTGPEPLPECHLLAEYITGTEWARDKAPDEGLCGCLVVWGALNRRGLHLSRASLERLVGVLFAAGLPVTASECFPLSEAPHVWDSDVETFGWEGLVFRTAGGRFARMKRRVTMDYVCIRADGGSAIGGLYNSRGQLVEKVSVPCPDVPQVGQVFEASGLAVTARGSLRNPRWERWRPDKTPAECTR